MDKRVKDLTGMKFGRWEVIEYVGRINKKTYWRCKCSCKSGTIKNVRSDQLQSGKSTSCGCLHSNIMSGLDHSAFKKKHGKYNTRLNIIWCKMKQRCYNKNNDAYKNYGGRGIVICEEWVNDFMNFYSWAIDNGYSDSLTLDRINNNGNYEPDNCRWATLLEQHNNTRRNHYIEYKGETHTISEWSRLLNVSVNNFWQKLNRRDFSMYTLINDWEELRCLYENYINRKCAE